MWGNFAHVLTAPECPPPSMPPQSAEPAHMAQVHMEVIQYTLSESTVMGLYNMPTLTVGVKTNHVTNTHACSTWAKGQLWYIEDPYHSFP